MTCILFSVVFTRYSWSSWVLLVFPLQQKTLQQRATTQKGYNNSCTSRGDHTSLSMAFFLFLFFSVQQQCVLEGREEKKRRGRMKGRRRKEDWLIPSHPILGRFQDLQQCVLSAPGRWSVPVLPPGSEGEGHQDAKNSKRGGLDLISGGRKGVGDNGTFQCGHRG